MPEYVRVIGVGDLPPGKGQVAEVNGREIAIFNNEGSFFAVDNTCAHRGGPLGEGELGGRSRDLSLARLGIRLGIQCQDRHLIDYSVRLRQDV
jgi:hypothetical protein